MSLEPITREEQYYAYLAGDTGYQLPDPITRREYYLYNLCKSGISGGGTGGGTGATAEQLAQIE